MAPAPELRLVPGPPRDDRAAPAASPAWEADCLARIEAGDRQAFGELFRAYAPPLLAQVLLPRLGGRAQAEEAVAETFRLALERLHQFRDRRQSIWPWLCRIALNQATDLHRERARTGKALASFVDLLGPLALPTADPHSALDRERTQARLRARIEGVLGGLNPRYRRAIELRVLGEKSRAECAQLLEVTVPTFDVLVLRALRAFRAAWDALPPEAP